MASKAQRSVGTRKPPSPKDRIPSAPRLEQLPHLGRGRWQDIAPFVGVSREKWRQLVNEGKAPSPLRLTTRCTLYDFSAVHAWIADPANFTVKEAQ